MVTARSTGPTLRHYGVEGDPVESICRIAEAEDADVIVVGAEDRGLLLRLTKWFPEQGGSESNGGEPPCPSSR